MTTPSEPESPLAAIAARDRVTLWKAFAGGAEPDWFSGPDDKHWTAAVDRLVTALARSMPAQPVSELLTEEEHRAMALTADLYNTLSRVVGPDSSRHGDMAEIASNVHAIQHTIMSQAAARAYPDRYRRLGHTLPRPAEASR